VAVESRKSKGQTIQLSKEKGQIKNQQQQTMNHTALRIQQIIEQLEPHIITGW